MATLTCQCGGCLEQVGEKGVIVTLRTPTFDDEKQAKFCCAAHAAASLLRLASDRKEPPADIPRVWRTT